MAFYTAGAEMIRPGVYHRYENAGGAAQAGARNGVCALAFAADWGVTGEVVTIESKGEIAANFGTFSGENIAARALDGGASKLLCVRVGTGGEKQTLTLMGEDGQGGAGKVKLAAKHAGERAFRVTVRDSLIDDGARELLLYEGNPSTALLAQILFEKGGDEAAALTAAVNAAPGLPVTASYLGEGALEAVQQKPLSGGENPRVTPADYGAAFERLEAYKWNVLLTDTCEAAVGALMCSFIDRAVEGGLLGMAVLSDPVSVPYETRRARAAALDSKNVIYVLNGGYDSSGAPVEGAGIAALIGGMAASVPSNLSLTHRKVPGIHSVSGALTNAQIESCITGGALVLTQSAGGAVWVESGVNTLKTLAGNEDAGWKKIRRVKTRYELIGRIDESVAGVIGQVNNDANGRATVMALAQGVINRMIAEGKLLSGEVYEDPDRPARGDSAYFALNVNDLDSAERVYLTYRFSFSAA